MHGLAVAECAQQWRHSLKFEPCVHQVWECMCALSALRLRPAVLCSMASDDDDDDAVVHVQQRKRPFKPPGQRPTHALAAMAAEFGFPPHQVHAALQRLADQHTRGDTSKLSCEQHQDMFLDLLNQQDSEQPQAPTGGEGAGSHHDGKGTLPGRGMAQGSTRPASAREGHSMRSMAGPGGNSDSGSEVELSDSGEEQGDEEDEDEGEEGGGLDSDSVGSWQRQDEDREEDFFEIIGVRDAPPVSKRPKVRPSGVEGVRGKGEELGGKGRLLLSSVAAGTAEATLTTHKHAGVRFYTNKALRTTSFPFWFCQHPETAQPAALSNHS